MVVSTRPLIAVYLGETGDHVVVEGYYCSCEGFMRRLARGELGCTHVYALREAVDKGRVTLLEKPPGVVARIVWEILTGGRSKTLRLALRGG